MVQGPILQFLALKIRAGSVPIEAKIWNLAICHYQFKRIIKNMSQLRVFC